MPLLLHVLPDLNPAEELHRCARAAALACIPGAFAIALGITNTCWRIADAFCTGDAMSAVALLCLTLPIVQWIVRTAFALLTKTKLVHMNMVYSILLLDRQVGCLIVTVILYTCRDTFVIHESGVIGRLLLFLLIYSSLWLLQRILLFTIATNTIWSAYVGKIRATVFAHETMAALDSFAQGNKKTAIQTKKNKNSFDFATESDECDMYTVHRSMHFELMDEGVNVRQAAGKLFDAVVARLHGASPMTTFDARSASSPCTGASPSMNKTPLQRKYASTQITNRPSPPPPPAPGSRSPTRLKQIFSNSPARKRTSFAVTHSSEVLTLSKLERALDSGLAPAALRLLDLNSDGQVGRDDFVKGFQALHDQRLSLHKTLHDYNSILHTLNKALWSVTILILGFVLMYVAGVDVIENRLTWLSLFVALGVVFGSTAQRFFEGCVLVFVTRPYDVEDKVTIRDSSGSQSLIVQKIELLSTHFTQQDGQSVICPNSSLKQSSISNAKRSRSVSTVFTVQIPASTTPEQVQDLCTTVENFRVRTFSELRVRDAICTYESTRADVHGSLASLGFCLNMDTTWIDEDLVFTAKSKFIELIHGYMCKQ